MVVVVAVVLFVSMGEPIVSVIAAVPMVVLVVFMMMVVVVLSNGLTETFAELPLAAKPLPMVLMVAMMVPMGFMVAVNLFVGNKVNSVAALLQGRFCVVEVQRKFEGKNVLLAAFLEIKVDKGVVLFVVEGVDVVSQRQDILGHLVARSIRAVPLAIIHCVVTGCSGGVIRRVLAVGDDLGQL